MMNRVGMRTVRGLLATVLAGAVVAGPACGQALAQDVLLEAQAQLPSRYDMREQGVVTPVKRQYPFGTCWAFGGIAAAETSILSELGTTYASTPLDFSERHLAWFSAHPITELEDPAQAGEGLHLVKDDDTTETYATFYNGGYPVYVTTLFSSGVGPVPEAAFPYQGNGGIVESDYIKDNLDELVADSMKSYAEQHPDLDEAEVRQKVEDGYKRMLEWLETRDYYAGEDDWSIPEADKEGDPNRLKYGGYTIRDGNVLPEVAVRDERPVEATIDAVPMGAWQGLSEDGMRAMKQEMLDGHAVSVVYHADSSTPGQIENGEYMNLDTWAQYTFDDAPVNHGVCVVGWDDTYPASNFTHPVYVRGADGNGVLDEERSGLTTPPGDGAWIVKNSWGSETDCVKDGITLADGTKRDRDRSAWGIVDANGLSTGYFYLSYYDKSLIMPESMDFDQDLDTGDGDFFVAQYDYMPSEYDFWELRSQDTIMSANAFTCDTPSVLHSVSSRTFEQNTRVTFRVVRLRPDSKNPEDGETLATVSKNFAYAGFHRVDLSNPVTLKRGERIAIVATNTTVDDSGRRIFGVEASSAPTKQSFEAAGEEVRYYPVAVVNPGESYLRLGDNWVDWADYQKTDEFKENSRMTIGGNVHECCVDNFAIKAYLMPTK